MTTPLHKVLSFAAVSAMAAALGQPASAQFRDERDRPWDQNRYEDRQGGEQTQIETFHDALDPYGRWFEHPQYGYVWSPDVDRNWRPYTRGEWKFTEEHGWYWQAEEPWGWAVFHYGRWFLDDDAGWVWVPGTEWAPAWVAWRDGDEAVGWAPLPPEAEWRHGGLSFSQSYYDSPRFTSAWIFAPVAVLGGYAAYRYIFPASRNYTYVNRTRALPSNRTVNNRIFNAGFDRNRAQQLTGRAIAPQRIVSAAAPPARGVFNRPGRGTVQIYRPNVSRAAVTTTPPKLAEPPRRDWQHGRPGLQAPPFQRPGGWTQPPPQNQPQAQPGFARPGQRPPIAPPAQVQQPAPRAQPAAPPRGQNPLIRPTPQVIDPVAPPPTPPKMQPAAPPPAPPKAVAPPPAAPPARAAAPSGAPPPGKGPPVGQGQDPGKGPGQGPGQGPGKGDQQRKRPADPNAQPPPKQ